MTTRDELERARASAQSDFDAAAREFNSQAHNTLGRVFTSTKVDQARSRLNRIDRELAALR
jgi:hypothetical protein